MHHRHVHVQTTQTTNKKRPLTSSGRSQTDSEKRRHYQPPPPQADLSFLKDDHVDMLPPLPEDHRYFVDNEVVVVRSVPAVSHNPTSAKKTQKPQVQNTGSPSSPPNINQSRKLYSRYTDHIPASDESTPLGTGPENSTKLHFITESSILPPSHSFPTPTVMITPPSCATPPPPSSLPASIVNSNANLSTNTPFHSHLSGTIVDEAQKTIIMTPSMPPSNSAPLPIQHQHPPSENTNSSTTAQPQPSQK